MKISRKWLVIILCGILFPSSIAWGAMTSVHYKIPSDTINFGGGDSQSTSYALQSTFGEIATGNSASAHYSLYAGYQQMQQSFIAISSSGNIALSNIDGLIGGTSTATSTWTVTTDNAAGYSLSVQAATSPALQGSGGASFADYSPASSNPDFQFTISPTQSAFGFSPKGSDILALYKDDGTSCNTGSLITINRCWTGFSTSPTIIAQSSSANQPNGTQTTLTYQAGIGNSKIQDNGSYSATITVTALSL